MLTIPHVIIQQSSHSSNEFNHLPIIPPLGELSNTDELIEQFHISNGFNNMNISPLNDIINKLNNNCPEWIPNVQELISGLSGLNSLIGLENVKSQVAEQVKYLISQHYRDINNYDLNTIIKSDLTHDKEIIVNYLSKIWYGLGLITNSDVKIVSRNDLIGKYVGHTTRRVNQVMNESTESVLMIDEAYSLLNYNNNDTFGREMLETLNYHMSQNPNHVIVLDHMQDDSPMSRRFPWRITNNHSNVEMGDI